MARKRVAFIGTGIMGAPIAGHLLDAGYSLVVNNRTEKKAEGLLARGAAWAETPAEAADGADVIFTMLGYPSDVEDVYLAQGGIVRAAKRGAWMVDLTTSSPLLAREIHDAAEVEDKHAFDCPVTGGEQGAIDGTLTAIIGAKEQEVGTVLPLIRAFAKRLFFFDAPGAGQTAKLCNQVSLASCMMGYAEALTVAREGGLDEARVLEMVGTGMGDSVALEQLGPKSVAGDYKPGFLAKHMQKDIQLALDAAEEGGYVLPSAETAHMLYKMLCDAGGQNLGTQALTLLYGTRDEGEAAGLDFSKLQEEVDEAADGAASGSADA